MRKRILSFVLAIAMVLTMLPVQVEAAATPYLGWRWADDSDGDGIHELPGTSDPLDTRGLSGAPDQGSPVSFYFVDENGVETHITDESLLNSSDMSVVSIYEDKIVDGIFHLHYEGFGTATIDYVYNGNTYSIGIDVDLPYLGFYSTPTASQATYLTDYMVTDANKEIYLVAKSGWTLLSAGLESEFAAIATIGAVENNQYAKVTINGVPDSRTWYYRAYGNVADTFTPSMRCDTGLRLEDGRPALKFRWPDWDNVNNCMIENVNNPFETGITISPQSCADVFCYFVNNGVETRLDASDITSSNTNVATVESCPENGDAVRFDAKDFGTTKMSYTYNGVEYSVDVNVDIPNTGFYSTSTASQSTYLREFTVTESNDTFYLVNTGDWKFDSAILENGFEDIATITMDASKKFATIKVTGNPDDNRGYDVRCEISDSNGNRNDFHVGLMLKNGKPSLQFRWPAWDNGPVEDKNEPLQSSYNNALLYDNPLFFYFVDGTTEVKVNASELVSSDPSIVRISANGENPDAVNVELLKCGNASLSYTAANGKTYSMDVRVELPAIGYYTSKTASESTYLREFTVTDTDDTIYLVARDNWVIDTNSLRLFQDFADIATMTAITAGKVYEIKITGNPQDMWYGVEFEAEDPVDGGRSNGNTDIRLKNGKPSLMCREPGWLPGAGIVEDITNELCGEYYNAKGFNNTLFFYYVDANGETRLDASSLKSSDENIVKVSADTENTDAVFVELVDFGEAYITYTDTNGKTFSLKVIVGLPDVGFYTTQTADTASFIRGFTVTETDDTFYLVAKDDWEFTSINWDLNLKEIATITEIQTNKVYEIKINGKPQDMWYGAEFSVEDPNGGGRGNGNMEIELFNGKPGIMFCFPNDSSPTGHTELNDYHNTAKGYGTDVFVYFVENGNEKKVSPADLKSSDTSVIKVEAAEGNPDMARLTTVGWGTAEIIYTDVNGKEYSFAVESMLQAFGYYKDNTISKENWITEKFQVTDAGDKLYFMADTGFTFDPAAFNISNDIFDVATMEVNAANNMVTFTFTERYFGFVDLMIDFEANTPFGDKTMGTHCITVLGDVCAHPTTELQNEKAATCTEDGYTGDTVCKECGETTVEGKVVPKLGHDYKLGECGNCGDVCKHTDTEVLGVLKETCTTAGNTGDVACKICKMMVTGGQVIPAAGHSYKNGVCTVCGDKLVVTDTVPPVDTSKPVDNVTPVVKQEALDKATNNVGSVVDAIVTDKVTADIEAMVSEGTIKAIEKALDAGEQITTEIVVNELDEKDIDKETVKLLKKELGKDSNVAQYIDLSVVIKSVASDGTEKELGTLNTLEEKVVFTLVVPKDLEKKGRTFYVLREHDGVVDKLPVTKNADGSYSFETDKFSTYALAYDDEAEEAEVDTIFNDVRTTDWFYDSVKYVYNRGLMTGMKEDVFGPAETLSRAQFAVILWRMNGAPEMEYKATFPDVPDGIWYTDAVLWANQKGIITGYSHNGHFGPADNITREQMAVMMFRYGTSKEYDVSERTEFSSFKDAASVSAFAKEAMQWTVASKIITGKENGTALDPQGNASRAECATIIMRFMEKYE